MLVFQHSGSTLPFCHYSLAWNNSEWTLALGTKCFTFYGRHSKWWIVWDWLDLVEQKHCRAVVGRRLPAEVWSTEGGDLTRIIMCHDSFWSLWKRQQCRPRLHLFFLLREQLTQLTFWLFWCSFTVGAPDNNRQTTSSCQESFCYIWLC